MLRLKYNKGRMESKRYKRVYVGNARSRSNSRELRDIFADCGRVVSLVLDDGEAYVEFAHDRDAEDAIRKLDGVRFGGKKLLVEYAVKSVNRRGRDDRDRRDSRGDRDGRGDRDRRDARGDRDGRGDRGDRRDRSDIKCFNCNERGHIARNCDQKPVERRRRRSRSEDSRDKRDNRDNRDRRGGRDDRARRDDSQEAERDRKPLRRSESGEDRHNNRRNGDNDASEGNGHKVEVKREDIDVQPQNINGHSNGNARDNSENDNSAPVKTEEQRAD